LNTNLTLKRVYAIILTALYSSCLHTGYLNSGHASSKDAVLQGSFVSLLERGAGSWLHARGLQLGAGQAALGLCKTLQTGWTLVTQILRWGCTGRCEMLIYSTQSFRTYILHLLFLCSEYKKSKIQHRTQAFRKFSDSYFSSLKVWKHLLLETGCLWFSLFGCPSVHTSDAKDTDIYMSLYFI